MPANTLNINSSILAFDDLPASSNPSRKVDHRRSISGIAVRNAGKKGYTIPASSSLLIFDGTRSTSINGTTDFAFALKTTTNRYRFTWNAAGAAPAFRAARTANTATHTLTWVVNANATVTLTSSAADFGTIIVGDTVFIPGTSTGDTASDFNALNEGYWDVLDATSTVLGLARPSDTDFTGYGEATVVSANAKFQAFSAEGVQIDDKVNVSAGFVASILGTYEVVAVNPTWFEISSTKTLPATSTGVPGATGMAFYTNSKVYTKVEIDQEGVVRANGDTTDLQYLTPWLAGDESLPAEFTKTGPMWSLTIVNKSTVEMNVTVISAE